MLVDEHPYRERLRAALMLALYRSGRQADALAAYQDARHALIEIGIEPSADLRSLEKAILTHDDALDAPPIFRTPSLPPRRRRRRRLAAAAGLIVAAAGAGSVILAAHSSSAMTVRPNSLAIIDANTNAIVGAVPVGSGPDSVAYGTLRGRRIVWVANTNDRTLSIVDPQTRQNLETISVEAQGMPTGLAVGFGAVWVAHGLSGTVSRVPLAYPRVETIRPPFGVLVGGSAPTGSITRGNWSMWVVLGNQVSRIDPRSRDWFATTVAGNAPSAIAYGLASAWVTNEADGTVTRIVPPDERTGPALTPKNPIKVGRRPNGVTIGGGAIWVANTGGDSVSRIDPAAPLRRATKIPVGKAPGGIAYGSDAVWVANGGDGTVSRIDPATGNVVATIHIGNSPRRIVVVAGKVFVTVQAASRT
jgi:YVTN family beta-propeller protein